MCQTIQPKQQIQLKLQLKLFYCQSVNSGRNVFIMNRDEFLLISRLTKSEVTNFYFIITPFNLKCYVNFLE